MKCLLAQFCLSYLCITCHVSVLPLVEPSNCPQWGRVRVCTKDGFCGMFFVLLLVVCLVFMPRHMCLLVLTNSITDLLSVYSIAHKLSFLVNIVRFLWCEHVKSWMWGNLLLHFCTGLGGVICALYTVICSG